MNLPEIRKAIVALLVPAIVAVIAGLGVDASPEVVAAVTSLLSALAVWAIPNRAPAQ